MPSVLWGCWSGGRKCIWPVKNWVVGVLAWLFVWSDLQICIWPSWHHCHLLSLASVKSRLILPFWHRLTWVVPDKGSLNVCVCVRACMRACVRARARARTRLYSEHVKIWYEKWHYWLPPLCHIWPLLVKGVGTGAEEHPKLQLLHGIFSVCLWIFLFVHIVCIVSCVCSNFSQGSH